MMNRGLVWITTAIVGAMAVLMTSFGLLPAVLMLPVAIPLMVRRARLVALSGLLTGFGATWTFLMVRQSQSGGTIDGATAWLAVGLFPLALGTCLLGFAAVRWRQHREAAHG